MRKVWKIIGRTLGGVLLLLYIAVALLNYSVVQSYLGAAAGHYFSKQWGGTVHIGAIHAMPLDHVILDNILLVDPLGDTIARSRTLRVSFRRFPWRSGHLELKNVYVADTYFHLSIPHRGGLNLKYIIDYFRSDTPKEKRDKQHPPFRLTADQLILNRVTYRQDLRDKPRRWPVGVEIPHMEFRDVRAKMTNIRVEGKGDVKCRIVRMSTQERSGFTVDTLSGQVHVGPSGIHARNLRAKTPESLIIADADLTWPGDDWRGIKGYVSTVFQRADIKPGTHVAMSDVAYWAPTLWGNPLHFEVHGSAYGTVDSLHTDGLVASWGGGTLADIEGTVVGLPRIDTSYCSVRLNRYLASVEQTERLIRAFAPRVELPEQLKSMGSLDLTATVDGGYDLRRGNGHPIRSIAALVGADLACDLGQLRLDATLHRSHATVNIASPAFALTPLHTDWISQTGLSLGVEAQLDDHPSLRNLSASLQGRLRHPVVRGNTLDGFDLRGELHQGKAHAEVADLAGALRMEIGASLADSLRHYTLAARTDSLNLASLRLVDSLSPLALLSADIEADLQGNDIDHLAGRLAVSDLQGRNLTIDQAVLTAAGSPLRRTFTLESDLADATLTGRFSFRQLPLLARDFAVRCIPSVMLPAQWASVDPAQPADSTADTANTWLGVNLRWKDSRRQLASLVPGLAIADGTRLDATFTQKELLKLVVRSQGISYGNLSLDDIGISGLPAVDAFALNIESGSVSLGSRTLASDVSVNLNTNHLRALTALAWGSDDGSTSGDLLLRLHRDGSLDILRPDFELGGHRWTLALDSARLTPQGIDLARLHLSGADGGLHALASLHGSDRDHIELDFDRFNLTALTDAFLTSAPLDLHGLANGHFEMYGLTRTPYFNAKLSVDSATVNGQQLGLVDLRSNWNAELNILNLSLDATSLQASGWLGLGGESPSVNLDVDFNDFSLAPLAPVLSSFASRFDGSLRGEIAIGGTLRNPDIVGEAFIENGLLKLDPTGVTYYFNDSIQLRNGKVQLDRFTVLDPRGNTARIDGTIDYRGLTELGMDIRMSADNLLVLDLPSGDTYYGTLLAQAEGTVSGTSDDLHVAVRARTNPGSSLTIPIDDRRKVKSQNYITFFDESVLPPTDADPTSDSAATEASTRNIDITADIQLTPDVQLNVPISLSEVDVTLAAQGQGDVHVSLPVGHAVDIIGNYEITQGSLNLLLISLITKNFTIEPGSSLTFQGSPQDARFDVSAVHSQRVNLSTLTGALSSIDNTQKYLQVENVVALSGTLQSPTVGFDIRLPGADQSVSDEVFAYIDRNSERDMLNQTISLLVRGRFYNVSGAEEASASSLGNGISLVASTLSSAMSDMVQFVDVNIDYKAANEVTNDQIDVNLSRDWGRWNIESTLGYGGNSRALENDANTPIIDATLSYRLNPLVYLFVYNRTNTNDYTRIDLPYKQGAGLRLSKDFDRWGDLFRRKRSKTSASKH